MRLKKMGLELDATLRGRYERRETAEARLESSADNGRELADEQLEGIAGGGKYGDTDQEECPGADGGGHNWIKTGNTRPGEIFGDLWPNYEYSCTGCGKTIWCLN